VRVSLGVERASSGCWAEVTDMSSRFLPVLLVGLTLCALRAEEVLTHDGKTVGEKQDAMLYPVLKGGKWGYIDETGKVVVEPRFKRASYFSDGLAKVVWKDWPEYIDRTGKRITEDTYMVAGDFSDGLALAVGVDIGRELAFIDKRGNVTVRLKGKGFGLDDDFPLPRFFEGYAVFYMGSGYGVLDKRGKVVVKPTYRHLDNFSGGRARALVDDDKWGYIDTSGKLVIPARFDIAGSFSNGLACVAEEVGKKRFRVGYIDPSGKLTFQLGFEAGGVDSPYGCYHGGDFWGWRFSEGLAGVQKGHLWGYVDKKGEFAIPPQFRAAYDFSEGLARVCDSDGKMSFIDRTGKLVFRVPDYDARDFVGPLAQVWSIKPRKLAYIDKQGRYVWPPTD